METSMTIERGVASFLQEARSDTTGRVWSGLIKTLHRKPDEGIHGQCAYELVRRGLTKTVRIGTHDARVMSPKLLTYTTLTRAAQRELMQQLTKKERIEMQLSA